MATIKFYPVGNGDTSLITLQNNKHILMDYRQHSSATDSTKPHFDIATDIKSILADAKKDSIDVLAFTHADLDHIEGSTEFFYLEHANKYQDSGRIKIDQLWVPAAMLLESLPKDELSSEFAIWRAESKHRFKNKKGIRVFSQPEELVKLVEKWDMKIDDFSDLIVDAGTIVDTFSLANDNVEFFVHSPFMTHCEESGKDIKKVRNEASLVFNIRFNENGELFNFLAVGDSTWEVMEEIVSITQYYQNEDRLRWDLLNIPHHSSYLALSDDKGQKETKPKEKIEELLLMGNKDAYMICSSNAFETVESDALNSIQPPHLQAKRCYEHYLRDVNGRSLIVTMENESKIKPAPVVIEFSSSGLTKKSYKMAAALATAAATPARAG
ncbi:ComEC/Rec2 family competence protein [Photobacterium iliopiscarium]|uniref:hypothetical protein n=1 Tax=Photobacterium iliopiscarium TaxID=56192 RepID=UPI000D16926B|nr:hypothetical protein [Photobacterium iliopiscarium]PSU01003.1 hypothetical protein C9I85_05890 [Photobacterium iliopiscarium]PSV82812.1 hypothetical protein C9J51_09705 [Photobacterium iliopiscarium]